MKNITVTFCSDAKDKNTFFSHALASLRELIHKDDSLTGTLHGLGGIQLISESNLASKLAKQCNVKLSHDAFRFLIRDFNRSHPHGLKAVKGYRKILNEKVYLESHGDLLISYALSKKL